MTIREFIAPYLAPYPLISLVPRDGGRKTFLASLFNIRLLQLLFQLNLLYCVRPAVAMGYMTTLAGLWGNGMASAACALDAKTYYPQCWGNHPYLGDLSPPMNLSFWAISSGGFFVCGLLFHSRNPSCWGQVNNSVIPSSILNTSYSSINSGGYHACAVRDEKTGSPGLVDCWGNDTFGQASPPSDQAMLSVTAGDFFTCGLLASTRRVLCWGQGSNSTEMKPPIASFNSIFAGRYHMCGIEMNTTETLCWGNNTYGQATPVQNVSFTVITGGYSFSCGLREDNHEAVCWGETYFDSTLSPAGVSFAAISSGDWFTCGVREDDAKMSVNCWGTQGNAANNYVPTSLKAAMGLCVTQCNVGEYELQDSDLGISNQCLGDGDMKVCLECLAGQQCPQNSSSTSNRTASSLMPPPNSSPHLTPGAVVGVVLSGIAAVIIGFFAVIRRRKLYSAWMSMWWRPAGDHQAVRPAHATAAWKDKVSRVVGFSREELQRATQGFSPSAVIGKGGFGDVYMGILDDGQVVAIKKAGTVERASHYDMELELLAQVNHRCLVNLVGYCEEDKCLVFEFMANGSLQDCLFHKQSARLLDWNHRMRIALQAARGLEYLHVYASPTIIHRDVKASNILLDEALDAHISDFGLSLYGPVVGQSHLSNQAPCGTVGYLDPEYYQTGRLTSKSDVYSFGVVLLELLSGRRAVEQDPSAAGIVSWALELTEGGTSALILDAELLKVQANNDTGSSEAVTGVIRLALQCVQIRGRDRPTMSEVASCLQDLVQPAFVCNEDRVQTLPSSSNCSSTANISSSAWSLEGR